jgi:membrane associated rhomboid family serine protease
LHGNVTHIGFNMLGLWMFGAEIERYVGPKRLLACYFASVVTAALTQLFIPMLFDAPPAPTIGASGGVFGLLLAYALMFPSRKVVPLIPPIPMPAWLFATIYAGIELFLGVTGTLSGIAHFAHLGGMIGSALVVTQWRRAATRKTH